jgi:FkbM family methyltransferase
MQRCGRSMESIRYIEIGANHPIQTNSTYLLYKIYNASGVLVEAIPRLADNLRKIRPRDTVVNCAITATHAETVTFHVHEKNELSSVNAEHIARFYTHGGKEKIIETITCPNMHINDFMKQYGAGPVDYLSIDIEGLDAEVIAAMDQVFAPTILQCEHSGRTDMLMALMKERGYNLLAITDVNLLFSRAGVI